jgi:hypothetical protein
MKPLLFIIAFLLLPNIPLAADPIREIQQSHISSNLPDTFQEFQKILERDLEKYFLAKLNRQVEIQYKLLRKAPTQSGVAYPKFYAWVNVRENNKIVESGAVRLASIDKTKIEVTNFVSKKKILKNPDILNSIFPSSLCEGIIKKANKNNA